MKCLYTETPEAFKYMFGQDLQRTVSLRSLPLTLRISLEVGSTSFQIIIVSAVVLFAGIGCAYLFAVASKYYTLKQLWTFILCLWVFLGIITPITMTRGANFLLIIAIGGVGYSFGLSWYFSIGFVAFESMAPPDRRSQYTGIYTLATNLGSAIGPLVYTIIVQYSNSQRLAICALPVFNFIALVIFRNIDFTRQNEMQNDLMLLIRVKRKWPIHAEKLCWKGTSGVLSGVLEKMTSTVAPTSICQACRKRSQQNFVRW